jgi:tripartite tricarboxylate transporter family receptor
MIRSLISRHHAASARTRSLDGDARRRRAGSADRCGIRRAGVRCCAVAGFFVPARTPAAVVQKLCADTRSVLAQPDIRQKMANLGSTVPGSSPEELALRLKAEMAKRGPIICDAHITIDD